MRKRILTTLLASIMVLSVTSCGNGNDTGTADSQTDNKPENSSSAGSTGTCQDTGCIWDEFTPYEETVTFSKVTSTLPYDQPGKETDTYLDNPFTRHVKERVNVEATSKWAVDPNNAEQKMSLAIATGDLPDMMMISDDNTFNQLVENDLIWDLTEVYDKCLSPWLKEQYDEYGDALFNQVTVDGKLMALPGTNIALDHPLLWIRQDWLDKLDLSMPQTIEDIEKTAKAFVESDIGGNGTIGLTIALPNTGTIYGGYGSECTIDPIFAAFGAFPGSWIERDGEAVWGSILPENKDALAKLAQWYQDGILDKEFAVRKDEDRQGLIASSRLGMGTAKQWALQGTDKSIQNDPEAEWSIASAPVNAEGKNVCAAGNPLSGRLCISKSYEHPEAIIKAMNAGYEMLRCHGEEGTKAYNQMLEEAPGLSWGNMPVNINMGPKYYIADIHNDIAQALEKNDREAMEIKEFRDIYDLVKFNIDHPKEDPVAWQKYMQRMPGAEAAMDENHEDYPVAYYGTTPTMSTKWAALTKMETETYLQIIMGEKPVDEFDNFVKQWLAMGGQEITDEVNELRVK